MRLKLFPSLSLKIYFHHLEGNNEFVADAKSTVVTRCRRGLTVRGAAALRFLWTEVQVGRVEPLQSRVVERAAAFMVAVVVLVGAARGRQITLDGKVFKWKFPTLKLCLIAILQYQVQL